MMKASEMAKKLIEGIALHGDADVRANGQDVSTLIFSDEENVPDMQQEPWFDLISH